MERVRSSPRTTTPTMNARPANAMVQVPAKRPMVRLARNPRNVSAIAASTASVAIRRAWVRAKHAAWQKPELRAGRAVQSPPIRIPTMNVRPMNATVREHANSPMEPRAPPIHNATAVSASITYAAVRHAPDLAKLAAQQKPAVSMAPARSSLPIPTPKTNAPAQQIAMALVPASSLTALGHVPKTANASAAVARFKMAFVATVVVPVLARRVSLRKPESLQERARTSRQTPIPTWSARPNAVDSVLAKLSTAQLVPMAMPIAKAVIAQVWSAKRLRAPTASRTAPNLTLIAAAWPAALHAPRVHCCSSVEIQADS